MSAIKFRFQIIGYPILLFAPLLICGQQEQIDSLTQLFQTSETIKEKEVIAEKLISAYDKTDRIKAIHYCEEAIKLSGKLRRNKNFNNLYLKTGRLWEQEDYYLSALSYYNQALELSKKNKNKPQMAIAYYRIANTERKLCNYQNAINNCFKCQKICEEINDTSRLIASNNCLGIVYGAIGEYDKSIAYFDKNISLATQLGNTSAIAAAYNNTGVVYEDQSDYNLAKEFYLKALALRKSNSKYKANALNNIANIYIRTKDFPEAKKYHSESFIIRTNIKDKAGLVNSYLTLSEYYFAKDSFNLAKQNLFTALHRAIDIDLKIKIKESYFLLHRIFNKEENFQQAYEYHKKYKEIYDDIFNIEKAKQVAYFEMQHKNNTIQEREEINRLKRNFIIVSSFVVVLIVLAFRFLHHKNRLKEEKFEKKVLRLEKDQIESCLEIKNKELSAIVLNQARVNGIIEKVKQDLSIIKYDLKKENQKPVQAIINDLNRNIKTDIWQEFELRFIDVHKEFYTKLLKNFSDLTSNEQRLCALLKLNMSTKEISVLTNQSIHSIETARYRLRKKLNIANTDIGIVNYLASIQ